MGFYSMPRYFQHLPQVGKPLKKADADNTEKLKKIEDEIHALIKQAQDAGKADADVNKRGELTARQRLEKLVEPGTWRPLNSLYNPGQQERFRGRAERPGPCQRQMVRGHCFR